MFLNVGGAVLTVISESVAPMHGGKGDTRANLENYRAEYYGAIAMVAIGLVVSFFFFFASYEAGEAAAGEPEPGNKRRKGLKVC